MASNRFILLAVVGLALGGGCDAILGKELNSEFCAAHPDDPRCSELRCTSSSECGALVCDVPSGECVQCTTAEPGACMGEKPVCGVDNACRACTEHSECGSEVCGPGGSCIDAESVAFVAPAGMGGTDNSDCKKQTPCTKVSKALATPHSYVKFSGTTDEGETVTIDNRNVTFLADPGAKLIRTSNGIVLQVLGTSQVSVFELEISGGSGAQGIGISVPAGSTAKLELARAKILNNAGGGISIDGATVIFDITNTFILYNGVAMGPGASQRGGAVLLSNNAASRFERNTVAFNASNGGVFRAGVTCDGMMVSAIGNIVYRNTEGAVTSNDTQRGGNCQFGNTLALGMVPGDLGFKTPLEEPFDFHLTASSPASVVDAAGACTGVDFDRETRPRGDACDLGADER